MNNKQLQEIEARLKGEHSEHNLRGNGDAKILSKDASALVAEVRQLQAALEWYADKSHYYNGIPRYYESGTDAVARLVADNGMTARVALTLREGAE
jgi:uncharacterized membrane-anchored protein